MLTQTVTVSGNTQPTDPTKPTTIVNDVIVLGLGNI